MVAQIETDLEYLMHTLRNGTTKIEGHLHSIEEICSDMRKAVEVFVTSNGKEIGDGNEDLDEISGADGSICGDWK